VCARGGKCVSWYGVSEEGGVGEEIERDEIAAEQSEKRHGMKGGWGGREWEETIMEEFAKGGKIWFIRRGRGCPKKRGSAAKVQNQRDPRKEKSLGGEKR